MLPISDGFEFDYDEGDIVFGRHCTDRLKAFLEDLGLERALVVCGENVGQNEEVIGSVRSGLGDRLGDVFDGTTPAKSIDEVYAGIEAMDEVEPDVLVGVGGGSSLDVARQMGTFAADGRDRSVFERAAEDGRSESPRPKTEPTPVIVLPTTFAGADISDSGSIQIFSAERSPTGQPIRASGSNPPVGLFYDPALFETTPDDVLAGSAMNGFNKAVETIYAKDATPITDGTAIHGLRLLCEAFPRLADGKTEAVDHAVAGMILAQYRRRVSILHAFGHGFARRYPVHQGVVHAIVLPHVLRYLFDAVDANRELLALALGIDGELSDAELADALVDRIVEIRDRFDLPSRLRDIDPVERDDFPAIAEFILADPLMANAPDGLDPSEEELKTVLRKAY